ncbi:hypothetical protein [Niabella sp.]|uniref:hypothetical protein n=1 Tax=Niabella sp. TaxID=1962976 RepID=UPI0026334F04|nr:hypothetical protein [Niabella sp.]
MNGFQFNTAKFDFWPIYEAIKKYYPIGVAADPAFYAAYPGRKALTDILVDNIHDDVQYASTWKRFEQEIAATTGKPVTGTTYGQQFCYSAYVTLQVHVNENFTHRHLVHFFVSLLGPFYTVIGESENTLVIPEEEQVFPTYKTTNYLVSAPHDGFAVPFRQIEQAIETRFEHYRFVPYWICQQQIEGLYLHHQNETRLPSIFNALFNDQLNLSDQTYRPVGDTFYKSEAWIKKDYDPSKDGQWTVYPPLGYFRNGAGEDPEG